MKPHLKTRPFPFVILFRFFIVLVILFISIANGSQLNLHAESVESDPSCQVSDWIAEAKNSIWGEYPTAQDPWPAHESPLPLVEPELVSRSAPERQIEPKTEPTPVPTSNKPAQTAPAVVTLPAPEPVVLVVESTDGFVNEVVRLTNAARKENGLPALTLHGTLCQAADIRVLELPSSPSPHLRPNGDPFYTVLAEINLSVTASGENYAIDTSEESAPECIVSAWLNSPSHRKNIMNAAYSGIAVSRTIKNGTTYIEQLFIG